jgi:hypothetical protein
MNKSALYMVIRSTKGQLTPLSDLYVSKTRAEEVALALAKKLPHIQYIVALVYPRKITCSKVDTERLDYFSLEESK